MKLKIVLGMVVGMMYVFAFAAISIDPIARTFTKAGGAATGNAKFFKVIVPENK